MRTAARAATARPRLDGSARRSTRKSTAGQSAIAAVIGKRIQAVIAIEKPNATAPKTAACRDTASSVSQSHIPQRQRKKRSPPSNERADSGGSSIAARVNGEYGADWPLPSRGAPHPFQRLRKGSEPSAHVRRTAALHGTIWCATSASHAPCHGPGGRGAGRVRKAWSGPSGERARSIPSHRKSTGSSAKRARIPRGIRRPSHVAATAAAATPAP